MMDLSPFTAFETQMAQVTWGEGEEEEGSKLNESLKQDILAWKEVEEGIHRSNAARCWHSPNTITKQKDKASFVAITNRFRLAFGGFAKLYGADFEKRDMKMVLQAWAMVSGNQDYANPHTHPNCHFSGVYYVDNGDEHDTEFKDNGAIEFIDPRGGVNQLAVEGMHKFNPRVVIKPTPGTMFLFPAWLRHLVHPFHGSGTRIAIACNARITHYMPNTEVTT